MIRILMLFLGLFALNASLRAESLTFVTGYICPMVCQENGKSTGYIPELLQKALGDSGYQLKFKTMDDDRARVSVAIGMAQSSIGIPEFFSRNPRVVPVEIPVLHAIPGMLVRADKQVVINTYDDLRRYVLVWTKGVRPPKDVVALFKKKEAEGTLIYLDDDSNLGRNAGELLISGKADMMLDDYAYLAALKEQVDVDNELAVHQFGEPMPMYLAVNPLKESGITLKVKLLQGLQQLKISGELEQLAKKYELTY